MLGKEYICAAKTKLDEYDPVWGSTEAKMVVGPITIPIPKDLAMKLLDELEALEE